MYWSCMREQVACVGVKQRCYRRASSAPDTFPVGLRVRDSKMYHASRPTGGSKSRPPGTYCISDNKVE